MTSNEETLSSGNIRGLDTKGQNSGTLSVLLQRGTRDQFASSSPLSSPGEGEDDNDDTETYEYEDEDDEDDDTSDYYGEYQMSDAQAQWEESLRQIEQLLTFILIPVVGKFFGRRFAYFGRCFCCTMLHCLLL